MARVFVSPELSDTIRELRVLNKISAKDVAAAIERSPSYISKIESNAIKTILEDELTAILTAIMPDCTSDYERQTKLLELLTDRYGYEKREAEVMYSNLDTVFQLIPIPEALASEISGVLSGIGVSIRELVERINGNEELSEADLHNPDLPDNEWFESSKTEGALSIRMKLTETEVSDILEGKTKSCNFVTMQAIVHYTFKFKMFDRKHVFTDEDLRQVNNAWRELLDKHKFFSMSRKAQLLANVHSKIEEESILNEFDLENQETINEILRYIKLASDMDAVYMNKLLRQFADNLSWDYTYMLRLVGFDFSGIGDVSYSNKVQMLREIKDVISKYRDMPEAKKRMDQYDDLI